MGHQLLVYKTHIRTFIPMTSRAYNGSGVLTPGDHFSVAYPLMGQGSYLLGWCYSFLAKKH